MHILVIRLSAMGDVALTLPAIRGALNDNRELKITVLTRSFFAPFFSNIDRLDVITPDFKERHKGLKGLSKLYKELKQQNFDKILDLHSVIRSKYISTRFRLSGTKVFTIKKDRKEKKRFLKSTIEPDLKHSVERYVGVFHSAGINCVATTGSIFSTGSAETNVINHFIEHNNLSDKTLIGIAPFAKHRLKMWPVNKVEDLIKKLATHNNYKILLFGGGKEETEQLSAISKKHSNCIVPNVGFTNELALINILSLMISMDSSNMHLAALSGIPVISVWGATHPGIGFSAWSQPVQNSIQIPKKELECRPCSIYGKGECKRKDFACMEWIKPESVYEQTISVISSSCQK